MSPMFLVNYLLINAALFNNGQLRSLMPQLSYNLRDTGAVLFIFFHKFLINKIIIYEALHYSFSYLISC